MPAANSRKKESVGDRITEIHISGMRCLEKVKVRTEGLTVLIGENGTGKSTIIEACELLHKAGDANFLDMFHRVHSGFTAMGTDRIELGVGIEGVGPELHYDFAIRQENGRTMIDREELWLVDDKEKEEVLVRKPHGKIWFRNIKKKRAIVDKVARTEGLLLPMLAAADEPSGPFYRAREALLGIEVHVAFEVMPYWVRRTFGRPSGMRGPVYLRPVSRVELLGNELANAYYVLKNQRESDHWAETLEYIRLGLGKEIIDVSTSGSASGGEIALNITFADRPGKPEPALSVSDGTLAFLAIVAALRLNSKRSLLVFDEPDLHLHPHLLRQLADFFEAAATEAPVLVATQNDQFLDALSDPARMVVICKLDSKRRAKLYRPDSKALARWLERYRGLGDLRGEGYEDFIIGKEVK